MVQLPRRTRLGNSIRGPCLINDPSTGPLGQKHRCPGRASPRVQHPRRRLQPLLPHATTEHKPHDQDDKPRCTVQRVQTTVVASSTPMESVIVIISAPISAPARPTPSLSNSYTSIHMVQGESDRQPHFALILSIGTFYPPRGETRVRPVGGRGLEHTLGPV